MMACYILGEFLLVAEEVCNEHFLPSVTFIVMPALHIDIIETIAIYRSSPYGREQSYIILCN